MSIGTVQGGSSLIKKVAFPHEHLVLSVVFAQFVTVLIELGVLTVAMLIAGNMVLPWLPVLFVIMVLLAIFSTGVAMLLASANVFFNDITYLWAIAAQLLFYATPVIWDPGVRRRAVAHQHRQLATHRGVRHGVHEVMYDLHMPSLARFAQLTLYAAASLAIGAWGFNRLSPKFAEVL